MIGQELIERVRDRLACDGVNLDPAHIAEAVRAEYGGVAGDTDVLTALRVLDSEFTGFGRLEELLRDDQVSDVLVTAPDEVWVDGAGGLRRSGVCFPGEDSVRSLAQRLALAAGRRLDEAVPYVDGWLTAGGRQVRLHAVLTPVAADGTCISLRVLRQARHDLDELRRLGTFDAATAELLRAIVCARLAFLVVGATGSGKSTLLSALLGCVPAGERIVCVEDAGELAPDHPQFVRLIARQPNVEGAGEVTQRDLVRQALRMRPDRIVVGEVRSVEVGDLLSALNTGHDGGAGTLHANAPEEVPARLEALAALAGLDRAALHSQLAAAVQLVLFMRRDGTGSRRLTEIALLTRRGAYVRAVPAWRLDTAGGADWAAGKDELLRLLANRGAGVIAC